MIGGNYNKGGDDFNNFSLSNLREQMRYGIQALQKQLDTLQQAYDALDVTEGIDDGGSGFTGDSEVNRNFRGDSSTDDRTLAGRQNDDEEYTNDDLNLFLRTATRSQTDNSIDMRTKEGRALFAAGWIDDSGFPIISNDRNRTNAHQMAGR